jgi:chemotaxis protein MotB
MSRRKKSEEKSGGGSDWLNTYADMVTLLLTFFVLLFAMSSVDVRKFDAMVESFTSAFSLGGGLGILTGSDPIAEGETGDDPAGEVDMDELMQSLQQSQSYIEETQAMRQLLENLNEFLGENQLEDTVSVSLDERGLIIRFQDSILFTSGSADLLSQSYAVMDEVNTMLISITNHVRVEGHTDNVPMNTLRFPSNWELSTGRATTVVRYLVDHGMASDRLSALGYAEFRPVVSNDTAEGRAKNRRVDIVVLRDSLARQEEAPSMTEEPTEGEPAEATNLDSGTGPE